MAIRDLLERLSRDRVLRRRLPREYGGQALFVTPDSALQYWRRDLGRVDPLLLGLAAELVGPGSIVWDVGANVGLFSLAAAFFAGPSGRVVAVEPDDWLTSLIRRSAATLPPSHAPVDVLTAAVSEAAGIAEFCLARRGRAGSHLAAVAGSTQAGGSRAVSRTVTVTLDGLLQAFPAPGILKIDVEGAELGCLGGGDRLLDEVRPFVLCEVGEESAAEVGELFRRHRFVLYDAAVPAERRRAAERPVWNTLAVPRERAETAL